MKHLSLLTLLLALTIPAAAQDAQRDQGRRWNDNNQPRDRDDNNQPRDRDNYNQPRDRDNYNQPRDDRYPNNGPRATNPAPYPNSQPRAWTESEKPQEVHRLIDDGYNFIMQNGLEKFLQAVTYGAFKYNPDRHDQMYLFVYDFQGNVLAHGVHPEMVGTNHINDQDREKTSYIKAFISTANANWAPGQDNWVKYYEINPETNVAALKTLFPKPVQVGNQRVIIGCGYYSNESIDS